MLRSRFFILIIIRLLIADRRIIGFGSSIKILTKRIETVY